MILSILAAGGADPTESYGGLERFREVFKPEFFDGSLLFKPVMLLYFAAPVALVVLGLWLWRRHQERAQRSAPLRVFHQVASALGLSLGDQVLLRRIAVQQGLPTPLTLLLSSATLEYHGQNYAQGRPSGARTLARLRAIRRALFGGEALARPGEAVGAEAR